MKFEFCEELTVIKYIHVITIGISKSFQKMWFHDSFKDFAAVCRRFVEICRQFGDLVDNLMNFAHDLPKLFPLGQKEVVFGR